MFCHKFANMPKIRSCGKSYNSSTLSLRLYSTVSFSRSNLNKTSISELIIICLKWAHICRIKKRKSFLCFYVAMFSSMCSNSETVVNLSSWSESADDFIGSLKISTVVDHFFVWVLISIQGFILNNSNFNVFG